MYLYKYLIILNYYHTYEEQSINFIIIFSIT